MHQGALANCKWSQKVTHTLVHTAAKCVSGLQHHWAPNVRSIAAACIWPPIYSPCNWTRVNAESVWIYCIHLRTLQHNWNLRLPCSWAPNVAKSIVSFCFLIWHFVLVLLYNIKYEMITALCVQVEEWAPNVVFTFFFNLTFSHSFELKYII